MLLVKLLSRHGAAVGWWGILEPPNQQPAPIGLEASAKVVRRVSSTSASSSSCTSSCVFWKKTPKKHRPARWACTCVGGRGAQERPQAPTTAAVLVPLLIGCQGVILGMH